MYEYVCYLKWCKGAGCPKVVCDRCVISMRQVLPVPHGVYKPWPLVSFASWRVVPLTCWPGGMAARKDGGQ